MIELFYSGHLGNNMFGYALGRLLSEELGLALTCRWQGLGAFGEIERRSGSVDTLLDCWGMFEDAAQERPGRSIDTPQIRYVMGEKLMWSGQSLNLPWLLREGRDSRIVLHGFFQRAEYYHPRADRIRRWFRFKPLELPVKPGPRDAIVHVRRSLDYRVLDWRLDVAYYVRALEQLAPDRVYVCGLGLDATLREALKPWNPVYLVLDAASTLALMARFPRIVMANSSFSWWGAFLSEAERIVAPVPVRGFMSTEHLEADLRVPDSRYTWIEDVPLEPWRFLRAVPGWTFHRGAQGLVLQAPGRPPAKCEPTPVLEGLLRWLEEIHEPFGLHELQAAGLGVRKVAAPALQALLRAGILQEHGVEPSDGPIDTLLAAPIAFGVS